MRLHWILTLALAFFVAFAFQNVNGNEHNKKGAGTKGIMHHGADDAHKYHPDVGRAVSRSSSKNHHGGSSGHSPSSGKHSDKSSHHNKKQKNKNKHRDGKKHKSTGKNQHHH